MKLLEIVVEKAVIPQLAAIKRDEAIAEIVDSLVTAGAIEAKLRDEYIKAIIRRENRGTTGFGFGVAVPHVKHTEIKEMAVAVAISQEGVDFNALDREKVHSIFLLLSPDDRPEDHLEAMNAIFGNLSKETFRRFLQQAKSVQDVISLLEETDAETAMR